jgi:hypothetical protein
VHLEFSDGSAREVDLATLMRGALFERIATEDDAFREVRVDEDSGTICWPNGADLDPDVLHGDFHPPGPAIRSAHKGASRPLCRP